MSAERRVIAEYFEKLEALDLDGFVALWDDEAVQLMPFAPPGMPARLEGKDAIRKQYSTMAAVFSEMRFKDLDVQPLQATGQYFARFRGEIRLKSGGSYNNDYASRFVVKAGKLVEVDEYFNPLVLQEAFGPAATAASAERAVHRVLESLVRAVDARAWGLVSGAFAPELVLDYGVAETLTPEGVVNRWRPLFAELTASEHTLRNVVTKVDGDRARSMSAFRAWHQLEGAEGGDQWVLEGTYEHELARGTDGWKITRMKMTPGAQTGNAKMMEVAKKKASAKVASDVRPSGVSAVTLERVSFDSKGETLAGLLFRPVAIPRDTKLPAVVVAGTWTSVKEQMASVYAAQLAERGFVTLAFDFRGFGESAGKARDVENPQMKIDDLRNAVKFLQAAPGVDRARIGALGVCAGAGYVAGAAVEDSAIRSLALVAPWLHNAELVKTIYGGAEGVAAKLTLAQKADATFKSSGVVEYVPAVSATDKAAAMPMAMDYYQNAKRGQVAQWGNRFAVLAWDDWLTFDPIALAPKISIPVQIVHSESAALPEGTKKFHSQLAGPKALLWTDGLQFDFYDQPSYVARAVAVVAAHLRKTLDGKGARM